MSSSGGMAERKRVCVSGARAACVVRALAEAQGLAVVEAPSGADLQVVEVEDPGASVGGTPGVPLIAVAGRRLREAERRALLETGAAAVLDAESSVLDVAFAFSDLLFGSLVERRRYDRVWGGVAVAARTTAHVPELRACGRLVHLVRSGAFLATDQRLPDGAAIEIEFPILARPVAVQGRVVYGEQERGEGMAIEFALGAHDVAPKLQELCQGGEAGAGEAAPAQRAV